MTYIDIISVLVVGGAVVVYAAEYARDHLDDEPPEGTTAHAEWLYATDQISLAEKQRRVDVYEDPEADKIRAAVEPISGISTARSFTIAERYDTLRELRDASTADLETIADIGPQRARAIRERVDE